MFIIKFITLVFIKLFSQLFYRQKLHWINPGEVNAFKDLRLVIFLNHTSLFEPLFTGFAPLSFLWDMAKRGVFPVADITMKRPILGKFIKLLGQRAVSITRKRDQTWEEFLESIGHNSLVIILPEGRMMRRTGLDKKGNPMTVKGGVADMIWAIKEGKMLIITSGGLHHIQAPGEGFPHLFRPMQAVVQVEEIKTFKEGLSHDFLKFKREVVSNLQKRKEDQKKIIFEKFRANKNIES